MVGGRAGAEGGGGAGGKKGSVYVNVYVNRPLRSYQCKMNINVYKKGGIMRLQE